MGFMDKVKSAASDVASEAKKATAGAQTKIEQTQLRKKADEAARRLGYLVYAERMHGTPAAAETESAVNEIAGLEAQIAAEDTKLQQAAQQQAAQQQPGPAAPQPPSAAPGRPAAPPPSPSSPEPSSGDFKL